MFTKKMLFRIKIIIFIYNIYIKIWVIIYSYNKDIIRSEFFFYNKIDIKTIVIIYFYNKDIKIRDYYL